jgi:putative DNA primase/helicase
MRERRFKIANLRGFLLENRAPLLIAALTVIRAYALAQTVDAVPLPSFENWSRLVREPLIWLGMADPCETQKTETDDESGSIAGIFEKLAAHFGSAAFTCIDVARLVGGIMDSNGDLSSMMLNNGCTEPSSPQKVGYWLRSLRDKNAGGFKMVHSGVSMVGAKWRLKRLNEDLALPSSG